MTHKTVEISHLHAPALDESFDDFFRRSGIRFLGNRLDHFGGELGGHVTADVNPEFLFLLNEEKPGVGSLFHIETHFLGFILAGGANCRRS